MELAVPPTVSQSLRSWAWTWSPSASLEGRVVAKHRPPVGEALVLVSVLSEHVLSIHNCGHLTSLSLSFPTCDVSNFPEMGGINGTGCLAQSLVHSKHDCDYYYYYLPLLYYYCCLIIDVSWGRKRKCRQLAERFEDCFHPAEDR